MESVTPDVPTEFEEVPAEVPAEVPEEVPEEVPYVPDVQAGPPPEIGSSLPPRVRKVRIETPPPKANHVCWNDKLQEHRTDQRTQKNERYGNLRIM